VADALLPARGEKLEVAVIVAPCRQQHEPRLRRPRADAGPESEKGSATARQLRYTLAIRGALHVAEFDPVKFGLSFSVMNEKSSSDKDRRRPDLKPTKDTKGGDHKRIDRMPGREPDPQEVSDTHKAPWPKKGKGDGG